MKLCDKAVADATEALALDPKHAAAYNSRGCVYLQKHQADQAIADLTQAIALSPDVARFYRNRAAGY